VLEYYLISQVSGCLGAVTANWVMFQETLNLGSTQKISNLKWLGLLLNHIGS